MTKQEYKNKILRGTTKKINADTAKKKAAKQKSAPKDKSAKKMNLIPVVDKLGNIIGQTQVQVKPAPPEPTPWYQTTPGIIGLVAGGILIIGGIGYAVTRKRK